MIATLYLASLGELYRYAGETKLAVNYFLEALTNTTNDRYAASIRKKLNALNA